MPAAAVAKRTPAIAGISGIVFGARGEMAVTGKLIRSSRPGYSRSKERRRFALLCPAVHVCTPHRFKDVDARHKSLHADRPDAGLGAGHNESKIRHFFSGAAGLSVDG